MAEKPTRKEWAKKILGLGKGKNTPSDQPAEEQSIKEDIFVADRILVIDDAEIDRMIIEDILVQAGYEVIMAEDGEEGIKLFRENSPALVITDMFMPKKSGSEVILEVLNEFPNARFIAMSSGGELDPEVALAVPESINIHTVAKPFDPEAILKAVKKLIGPPGAATK